MRSIKPGNQTHELPDTVSPEEALRVADLVIEHRKTIDVTPQIKETGEWEKFLRNAISAETRWWYAIKDMPNVFSFKLTGVIPPGAKVTDVSLFILSAWANGKEVGHSIFNLHDGIQTNPSWKGSNIRAEHSPIDLERKEKLRKFLSAVDRSYNDEQSYTA